MWIYMYHRARELLEIKHTGAEANSNVTNHTKDVNTNKHTNTNVTYTPARTDIENSVAPSHNLLNPTLPPTLFDASPLFTLLF